MIVVLVNTRKVRGGNNRSYQFLEMRNAELIFIPAPTVGHLVPSLELARRLIDQDDRIRITVLVMKLQGQSHLDTYVKSIGSSLPFVRFIDVPELEDKPTFGSTQSAEAFVYDFIERNIPLVRNIVMDILSSPALDGVTVKGIVADFFCLPMVDVAKDVSLPFHVFLTTNSVFLAMMQYLADRHSKDTSVFVRNSGEMLSIPGFVNPVPANVLPTALFMEDGYEAYVKLAILFAKAKGILVNTYFDLEPISLNHFHNEQNYPSVYAVGPVFNPNAQPHPDQDLARRDELVKWLDDQPEASVVFLCFGSMGRLSGPLVKEIAHGLELCQYRFLWSLRTEEVTHDDLFPEGFLDRVSGRGMICGWSPQVEILAHKAVGSFVSHCGWNSLVESLWFGVPIVTWPMYAEQQLNAFLMVKELNLAVEMKLDYRVRSDDLVNANEIETAIRCVMNEDNNLVRKRVIDISQMARKATLNGGSSYLATEKFIQDVIGIKP
nr:UDP-glucosyltransferase 5 [Isatis tinctoria]